MRASLSVIIGAGVRGQCDAGFAKERKEPEAREKEENRRWGQRVKESGRSMRWRNTEEEQESGDTVRPALVPVPVAFIGQPTSESILFRHAPSDSRSVRYHSKKSDANYRYLLDNCSRTI